MSRSNQESSIGSDGFGHSNSPTTSRHSRSHSQTLSHQHLQQSQQHQQQHQRHITHNQQQQQQQPLYQHQQQHQHHAAYRHLEDSTESEAEESSNGWSDGRPPHKRGSLSSSDDPDIIPSPHPSIPATTITGPDTVSSPSRSVSFSSTTVSHRRLTTNVRPSLHTAGSNISLDTISPSSILNDTLIPPSLPPPSSMPGQANLAASSSGYASPAPPYPGEGYTHPVPRIRRKSLSHVNAPGPAGSDTSTEDYPSGLPSKGKKKRNRDGSFSLPFHRRRRTSNAYPYTEWPAWLGHHAGGVRKYGWPLRTRYLCAGVFFLIVFIIRWLYREWRENYDWEITVIPLHGKADEVETILPLKGCFDPKYISPAYTNSSMAIANAFGTRHGLLSPGVALGRGTACYDFAATIEDLPENQLVPLTYHTYWRADLLAFGERQMATVVAFLATQPLSHSKLIVWTNGADMVRRSEHIRTLLAKWGQYLEVRQVDMPALTRGTGLEGLLGGTGGNGLFDERAWVDGDAVRLLVLWHYGGVWMDMDQILTRNLHALTENEFVVQWDCYGEASPFHEYHLDQPFFILNGALMHFRQHSPYLCEAFHIMASSPLPKPNTFTWGSHLYSALHRRLLAAKIRPFAVLPWCFADPRNCDWDIAFPDPFGADPEHWAGRRWDGKGEMGRSGREMLEERAGQVWSLHLHNQWGRAFPPGGWVERLLDGYRSKVGILRGRKGDAGGSSSSSTAASSANVGKTAGGVGDGAATGTGTVEGGIAKVVPVPTVQAGAPGVGAGAAAAAGVAGRDGQGLGTQGKESERIENENEKEQEQGKGQFGQAWDKVLGDDADVADELTQAIGGAVGGGV